MKYRFNNFRHDPQSWFNVPKMAGHTWAKNTVNEIERVCNKYSKTRTQKLIISKIFDFEAADWHYFNRFCKKDVANILFVLKNIVTKRALGTLFAYLNRSGMWREHIERILHVMAYDENPQDYIDNFKRQYISLGMKNDDAVQRVKNLVEMWRKDVQDD